jgi:hypothetical protein
MKSPIDIQQTKENLRNPFFAVLLVASVVAQLFFPWWSIAIVCLVVAFFMASSAAEALAKGTAVITLGWVAYAWYIHATSGGILSNKVAEIFPLKGNSGYLIAIMGFLGGLVGGLSASAGYLLRDAVWPRRA